MIINTPVKVNFGESYAEITGRNREGNKNPKWTHAHSRAAT